MNFDIVSKLYFLPAIILGLTIHEFSHALSAHLLGDDTAKAQGRLTLNPLKHLDPIGFFFIIIAGFGWAKPVVFDKRYLKVPRRDEALIAIAGPLSNLLLGILGALVLKLAATSGHSSTGIYPIIINILFYIIYINFGLFIFNMIPIPPLDGSHVLLSWLNLDNSIEIKLYRFGMPVLFGIIILENFTHLDILPIGKAVQGLTKLVFSTFGM